MRMAVAVPQRKRRAQRRAWRLRVVSRRHVWLTQVGHIESGGAQTYRRDSVMSAIRNALPSLALPAPPAWPRLCTDCTSQVASVTVETGGERSGYVVEADFRPVLCEVAEGVNYREILGMVRTQMRVQEITRALRRGWDQLQADSASHLRLGRDHSRGPAESIATARTSLSAAPLPVCGDDLEWWAGQALEAHIQGGIHVHARSSHCRHEGGCTTSLQRLGASRTSRNPIVACPEGHRTPDPQLRKAGAFGPG